MIKQAPGKLTLLKEVWQGLLQSSPIAVYRPLIDITGSVKAAIFLSQLIYWTKVGTKVIEHNGWIRKSTRDWMLETGLSKYEQETARKHLAQFIQVKRQGLGAELYFRLNITALSTALANYLNITESPLTLEQLRNNVGLFRTFFRDPLPYYRDLAYLTQNIHAALMLSYLIRRIVKDIHDDTCWHKQFARISLQEWKKITGLSSKEQFSAREKLKSFALIYESHKTRSRSVFTGLNTQKLKHFFENALPNLAKSHKGGIASTINVNLRQSKRLNAANDFACIERESTFKEIGKGRIEKQEKGELRNRKRENKEIGKRRIQYNKLNDYSNNNYNYNNENPKNVVVVENLIWPSCFKTFEKTHAVCLLEQTKTTPQVFLDEIAGQRNIVQSPLGLLRKLISADKENQFIPLVAGRVKDSREQFFKMQQAQRIAQAADKQKIPQGGAGRKGFEDFMKSFGRIQQ